MYVAIAYANREVGPLAAVLNRLEFQGATYVLMVPTANQWRLFHQNMPVSTSMQVYCIEISFDAILQACEAEGIADFFIEWSMDAAIQGLVTRQNLKQTVQAFQSLGRAFQQAAVAAGDFGIAVSNQATAYRSENQTPYPDWLQKGAWVQDKITQRRGQVLRVRARDVSVQGYLSDFQKDTVHQTYEKSEALATLEPYAGPTPRISRWALID